MASPQGSQKLFASHKVAMFDHDPGATSAKLVSGDGGTTLNYFDMRDFSEFGVVAMSSTLTGNGITKLEIVASADTAFTSVTVIKDSGTVAADAVGDYVAESCTAEEVAQEAADAGVNLRYVSGRITMANSADEAVVTYIGVGNRAFLNQTANTIA